MKLTMKVMILLSGMLLFASTAWGNAYCRLCTIQSIERSAGGKWMVNFDAIGIETDSTACSRPRRFSSGAFALDEMDPQFGYLLSLIMFSKANKMPMSVVGTGVCGDGLDRELIGSIEVFPAENP